MRMEVPILGILAGAMFTGLVQSSAATMGIAIVMASEGLMTLPAGIALAFGSNIGTCATAGLAAIGSGAAAIGVGHVAGNFLSGAQNLSSVEPTELFQDPFDNEKPVKMLRWGWSSANLADSSAQNPYTDARAHRGSLKGDDLIIGYSWTPNWGRNANDKYDFYVRRSFDGGQTWSAPLRVNDDPGGTAWQWFGTMSVSPEGRIDVVWNDTRNDPSAQTSELYYAWSTDAGSSFSSGLAVSPSFNSLVGHPNQGAVFEVNLTLAGRAHLVVMYLDLYTQLLQNLADIAAQVM